MTWFLHLEGNKHFPTNSKKRVKKKRTVLYLTQTGFWETESENSDYLFLFVLFLEINRSKKYIIATSLCFHGMP